MKDFFGDIIVTLDTGEILLIEMYSDFGKREYNKSYSYSSRAYSNQMKVGDEAYENCKNVICLNLMSNNYRRKNNELINNYEPVNIKTFKTLDNAHIKMVLLRLDIAHDIKYNEDIHRFIKWLKIIYSKSFKEMESIARGVKVMEQSIEFIKRYCNSNLNHGFQDILNEKVFEATERGEKRGKQLGIKLGEQRGIKQNQINIAEKMLKDNLDVDIITKYTGISKKQISQLMQGKY